MGKVTGFREYDRQVPAYQQVEERIRHWREFLLPMAERTCERRAHAAWTAACPSATSGCPLGNVIPDFNDHVYQGRWRAALESLTSTNDFPEFTGRVCPAPCESACVLGINRPPVTIKSIEVGHHRARLRRGLDDTAAAVAAQWSSRGRRGLRPGRAGGRGPAQSGRSPGDGLRARRPHRRPAALRHPRLQARRRTSWSAAWTSWRAGGITFRTGVHVGVDYPGRAAGGPVRRRGAGRWLNGAA